MKYRARNHIVNAEQFDARDVEQHVRFGITRDKKFGGGCDYKIKIRGQWGWIAPGDYIVWTDDWRRVLTPDEFAAEFEAVGEEETP